MEKEQKVNEWLAQNYPNVNFRREPDFIDKVLKLIEAEERLKEMQRVFSDSEKQEYWLLISCFEDIIEESKEWLEENKLNQQQLLMN